MNAKIKPVIMGIWGISVEILYALCIMAVAFLMCLALSFKI